MSREFKTALDKRRVVPFSEGRALIGKELEASQQDLEEATIGWLAANLNTPRLLPIMRCFMRRALFCMREDIEKRVIISYR